MIPWNPLLQCGKVVWQGRTMKYGRYHEGIQAWMHV